MTLKKLSEITGYSMITISRAINNPDKLKKETLEIIQKAIKEHNYTPNSLAQGLVYNRTNIIYLYMPADLEATHPFTMQLISGINSYAGEEGYSVLLKRTWYNNEPCDGLIIAGISYEDEERLLQLNNDKPCILFGHNDKIDFLDVNNYEGSKMMTTHLIKQGYRKITYFGIDQPRKFTTDRLNGHMDALRENNLDYQKVHLIGNDENEAYKKGLEILEDCDSDVIACASDYIAIGVIRAAQKLNINVPKDLGVTGFDGLGFENLITPNVTTVRQPIYEIGRDLAKSILLKIKEKDIDFKSKYYIPSILEKQSIKSRGE